MTSRTDFGPTNRPLLLLAALALILAGFLLARASHDRVQPDPQGYVFLR